MLPMWKEKPQRSEKYKAFIASKPCLNHRFRPSIPHHEQEEGHGCMGGKCSDFRCLPLCHSCHMKRHDVGRSMYEVWGIDPEIVISQLNEEWRLKNDR